MTRLARPLGLLAGASAFALAATLAFASPASAAATPLTWDCQAKPPIGAPQQLPLTASVQGDAPATVAAGAALEISLAPAPETVPAEAAGYPIENLRDLKLRVPVPAGSTFQSAKLTGGSNLGGTPTVSQANNVVTVVVPGPIAGGATFQLPALQLGLTASGAAGTAIESRLAGTGYDNPGLTFTAKVKVGFISVDVPTSCFANPSPTLTTTAIG